MALPKLMHPTFELTIPSTKKKARFRPFLVKEEKLLLMAKQSGESNDIVNVIEQVIINCDVDNIIEPQSLASFDIETLFLKLRAKSVGEEIDISYRDPEDDKTYDFKINIDDVNPKEDPEHSNIIKLSETSGIVMRYPNTKLLSDVINRDDVADVLFFMIKGCLQSYYDGDLVVHFKDATPEEIDDFVDSLPSGVMKDFERFFDTMPKLYHKLEYTNEKGTKRVIELTTIEDFFT